VDGLSEICIPFKVFTGRYPFGDLRTPVVITTIVDDKRPTRPQETQKLGLTDSVWDMTLRCWEKDPASRPTVMEVVGFLREWPVFSLRMNQRHDVLPTATGLVLRTCLHPLQFHGHTPLVPRDWEPTSVRPLRSLQPCHSQQTHKASMRQSAMNLRLQCPATKSQLRLDHREPRKMITVRMLVLERLNR